jgi:hypothetical protein
VSAGTGPAAAAAGPDRAPIFLIGTGRSGTNLLRMMLNAHPRLYILHEGGFYFWLRYLPEGATVAQWLDRYFRCDPFFPWYRLDPAEIRAELRDEADTTELGKAFVAIMRRMAERHGRARFGSQSPLNTPHLDRLFADFPAARVILLVRDPRTTIVSFQRRPSSSPSILLNCSICQKQLEAVRPFLDRVLEIRLEDLLAQPEPVLRRVLDFVGEPWHDAVLDHAAHTPLDLPPFPWFRGQGRAREAPASSRDQLAPAWVRYVERRLHWAMERYGYPRASLPTEPGRLATARAVLGDVPALLQGMSRMAALDRGLRRKDPIDAREFLRQSLRMNPAAYRFYPGFTPPDLPAVRGPEPAQV